MKRIALSLLILLISTSLYAADTKTSGLDSIVSPTSSDYFPIVNDDDTSNKKITIGNLLIDSLISDDLTVNGYMLDTDIDTFSELQAWVADAIIMDTTQIDSYAELDAIVLDQTLVYSGGAFHDGFSDFESLEHIDWTADQGATNIHAGNYTDTNTNASSECVGTTTYYDGEGFCDDLSTVYAPVLGADDNYVTDAEKVVIGNTSGTNTGDQDLSGKQDNITLTTTGTSGAATLIGATLNIPQYTAGGGGDVVKVGTPLNDQVGIWTGDGTLEGDTDLTFNGTILTATGFAGPLTGAVAGNASTSTALAANGANCSAGSYPLGVDASGAVETCTADSDTTYTGGTNLTLSTTTFNVDDAFIKNDADDTMAGNLTVQNTITVDYINSIGGTTTVENTLYVDSDGPSGWTFEGETADPCSTLGEGAIFYNTTGNFFCYCDGTNDIKMNDNTTACF